MDPGPLVVATLSGGVIALVVTRWRTKGWKSAFERERQLTRELARRHSGVIAVTDSQGRILATSAVFDARFKPEPADREPPSRIHDLLDTESSHLYDNILSYVLLHDKPVQRLQIAVAVNGENRRMLLSVAAVEPSPGPRSDLLHTFENPHESTAGRVDMERLEKLTNVGQIAAGIAHGLNTPLGAIMLSADLVAEMNASPDCREEADKIKSQASHCSHVVKELLRYVKRDEQTKSRCTMKTLIGRVQDLLEQELRERDIRLDVQIDTDDDMLFCDENQIEQLFINLFSNSLHAIGQNGQIGIHVSHDSLLNQLVVRFSDTGGGIPPRVMNRIFEPFFTTKPGVQGTGLGLSICQRIMVDHGGRIEASNANGTGATFTLCFPAGT